jgi:hypothetical protein
MMYRGERLTSPFILSCWVFFAVNPTALPGFFARQQQQQQQNAEPSQVTLNEVFLDF